LTYFYVSFPLVMWWASRYSYHGCHVNIANAENSTHGKYKGVFNYEVYLTVTGLCENPLVKFNDLRLQITIIIIPNSYRLAILFLLIASFFYFSVFSNRSWLLFTIDPIDNIGIYSDVWDDKLFNSYLLIIDSKYTYV